MKKTQCVSGYYFWGAGKKSILIFVKLFSQKIIFKGFFGDIFLLNFSNFDMGRGKFRLLNVEFKKRFKFLVLQHANHFGLFWPSLPFLRKRKM